MASFVCSMLMKLLCFCGNKYAPTKPSRKTSKWTYWNIYITHGLDGALWHLLRVYPMATVFIVVSLMTNVICTFATQELLKSLSIETGVGLVHIVWLIVVLFFPDLKSLLSMLLEKHIRRHKSKITEKILYAINYTYEYEAPLDIYAKYSNNDYYHGLHGFMWIYDNTTDSIIETSIGIVRSIVICAFVLWNNVALFPIIGLCYILMWKYMIPWLYGDKEKLNSTQLREATFNATVESRNCIFNPQFRQFGKANVVDAFMKLNAFFRNRGAKWQHAHSILNLCQNIMLFVVFVMLYMTKSYATIIVVLLNKDSFFAIVRSYVTMVDTEKHAEKSLEPIVKILDDIDEMLSKLTKIKIDSKEFEDTLEIEHIDFEGIEIDIKATGNSQSASGWQGQCDEQYNRKVVMGPCTLNLNSKKRGVLLVGPSGFGKSILIKEFAGLKSLTGIMGTSMSGVKNNKKIKEEITFDDLRVAGARLYIGQDLAEVCTYNGAICMSLGFMFPEASSVEEIKQFLMKSFMLSAAVIPQTLDEKLSSKLSDGERIRYVCASQLWKALHCKKRPHFMLLDEIDRALDAQTAEDMIKHIFAMFDCCIIMVTHSPDVRKALSESDSVSTVCEYAKDPTDEHVMRIHPHFL